MAGRAVPSRRKIKSTTLPNGMVLAFDSNPYANSCALNLSAGVGSSVERRNERGVAHLCEHMLFKGTRSRTEQQISREIGDLHDAVNAYTDRDSISIEALVVPSDVPRALALMFDMFTDSVFASRELTNEKQVVLQEIRMRGDDPDEMLYDGVMSRAFAGTAYEHYVGGVARTVRAASSRLLRQFWRRHARREPWLLVASGRFDEQAIEAIARRATKSISFKTTSYLQEEPIAARAGVRHVRRELNHTYFTVGYGLRGFRDPDFSPVMVDLALRALGYGAASRLFRDLRNDHGLVYSIGSEYMMMRRAQMALVTGSTSPVSVQRCLDICAVHMRHLVNDGITRDELNSARRSIMAAMTIMLDDAAALADDIATSYWNSGVLFDRRDLENELTAASLADVNNMVRRALAGVRPTVYVLGGGRVVLDPDRYAP